MRGLGCRRLLEVIGQDVLWSAVWVALSAAPLMAQSSGRWSLSVGLEGLRYGATARDTTAEPASAVDLRPSGRIGVRAGLHRNLGAWGVGLALGWAQGSVEAANEAVAIRDRTADLSRYRTGLVVERRLARVGAGIVALEVTPALDLWALDGETRMRTGIEAGLTLRVPLSGVAVEHRLIAGLSASPLEAEDLGGEFELRTLRVVGFGVGVRAPL